ncbi:MBL fold metallo-hydrolase [Myxococcota bacterium]|nr:MBL fold metallo-hydrolase [Myxococcota bacterium]
MTSIHSRITVDADVLPRVTACYLRIAGDECAFVETNTAHSVPKLLAALAAAGRRPEDVRFVIVTHAHLDHASGAGKLMQACPNATLVAHPRTAKHLADPRKLVEGATAVYGPERFATMYGALTPVPAERVRALADGESIELGGARLTAWHTYGHAFHHMIVDDPATETVYTGDTFGLVYPALQHRGRFALPSTSPTGFEPTEAKRSLDKVLSLRERFVAPTHFDAYEDQATIATQLHRFLDRAAAWVDEGVKSDLPEAELTAKLARAWRSAITEEAPHLGPDHHALLDLDVELNAQGLAHAALERRAAAAKKKP